MVKVARPGTGGVDVRVHRELVRGTESEGAGDAL